MSFTRNDIQACAGCGQGVGVSGPVFYRLKIEQMVLDARAVQREAGLEQMLGGNVAIARALSPETDFAQVFLEAEVLLCGACGIEPTVLAILLDQDESDKEEDG